MQSLLGPLWFVPSPAPRMATPPWTRGAGGAAWEGLSHGRREQQAVEPVPWGEDGPKKEAGNPATTSGRTWMNWRPLCSVKESDRRERAIPQFHGTRRRQIAEPESSQEVRARSGRGRGAWSDCPTGTEFLFRARKCWKWWWWWWLHNNESPEATAFSTYTWLRGWFSVMCILL